MHKIITIGREFGSGGRELGKRLAEKLEIPFYDKEILTAIAEESGLAHSYVEEIVEGKIVHYYPIMIGRTFAYQDVSLFPNDVVFSKQSEIIRRMAEKGSCVIVGRCADYILRDMQPLNIFVYADLESRMERCFKRAPETEHFSPAEMKKHIQKTDKKRADYYQFYTGMSWGDKANYDICVNTSRLDIKRLAAGLAAYVKDID